MVAITVLACLILLELGVLIVMCNRWFRILRHIERFVTDCEEAAEEEADWLPDEDDESWAEWLCDCGHLQEDDLHCDVCGGEPPWGCPCEACECRDEDDEEFWEPDHEGERVP